IATLSYSSAALGGSVHALSYAANFRAPPEACMLGANAGRRRTDGGAAVRRSAAAQGQLGENRWLCVAGHIPAAAAGASCNHQRGDTAMKMFIALTILALALLG